MIEISSQNFRKLGFSQSGGDAQVIEHLMKTKPDTLPVVNSELTQNYEYVKQPSYKKTPIIGFGSPIVDFLPESFQFCYELVMGMVTNIAT